jgi:hypothetical protein
MDATIGIVPYIQIGEIIHNIVAKKIHEIHLYLSPSDANKLFIFHFQKTEISEPTNTQAIQYGAICFIIISL